MANSFINNDLVYFRISTIEKMQGKTFGDLQLQRKDKVKTQAKPKKTKIISQDVTVNSQQLFNIILCIVTVQAN